MTKYPQFITDQDTQMTELLHALIDQGLTRGLQALEHTPGVTLDRGREWDVLGLAALRLLTTLPQHAAVHEIVDGLHRRAMSLTTEAQQ